MAQKTILVAGDSLSAAYGISKQKGWVELLQKRLARQGYPYKVINTSISGATSLSAKNVLPNFVKKYKPSISIIEIGANDGLRGLSLKELENNIRQMILVCRQHSSKVLLVGMRLPPNYGPEYTKQFHQIYLNTAKSMQTSLVPFLLEGVAADMRWMQSDGIHPTEQAQPKLLENIWMHLKPLL